MSPEYIGLIGVALGSVVGFAGTWVTSRRDLQRVQNEMEIRLRELEEPHRQHREGVYHNFLDVVDRLHYACGRAVPFAPYDSMKPLADQDSAASWWLRYEHSRNAVRLFGDSDLKAPLKVATDAVEAVVEAVGINAETRDLRSPEAYIDDLQRRLVSAHDQLADAMHKAVAASRHKVNS